MTRKSIQIILSITLIVGLLGSYYWFIILPSINNTDDQEQISEPSTEIFDLQASLPEGWRREVGEGLVQENAEQETIEFTKDGLLIRVTIRLTRVSTDDEIFTGFIPETREYLTTTNNPLEVGNIDTIKLGRVASNQGYALVDLDSFIRRDGEETYIYELPLLVSREGFETKTVITYILGDQPASSLLLDEADKLVLSLNTQTT